MATFILITMIFSIQCVYDIFTGLKHDKYEIKCGLRGEIIFINKVRRC